jgi:hypothetical protein
MIQSSIIDARSAPQAALRYISIMNEKRPYSTFPYASTQSAKRLTIASNLPFWAFTNAKTAYINQKAPFSLMQAPTCTVQVPQLVCSAFSPSFPCFPSTLGARLLFPVQFARLSLLFGSAHRLTPVISLSLSPIAHPSHAVHCAQLTTPNPLRQPAITNQQFLNVSSRRGPGGVKQLFIRQAPNARRPTIRLAPLTDWGAVFPSLSRRSHLYLSIFHCTIPVNHQIHFTGDFSVTHQGWNWVPLCCLLDLLSPVGDTLAMGKITIARKGVKKMPFIGAIADTLRRRGRLRRPSADRMVLSALPLSPLKSLNGYHAEDRAAFLARTTRNGRSTKSFWVCAGSQLLHNGHKRAQAPRIQ